MGKFVDLSGKRFGKLVVIEDSGSRSSAGSVMWVCRCDCGNMKTVRSSALTFGETSSCGCGMSRKIDLSGQRFGRLLVVEDTGEKYNSMGVMWLCQCDCGNTTVVGNTSLVRGYTSSCGCLRRELATIQSTIHGMSKTREYINAQNMKRIEMKRGLDSEWTYDMSIRLSELFPQCVLCGSGEDLEIDHVRPLSRGFGLKPGNAVILCSRCNNSKHDRDLDKLPEDTRDILIFRANEFMEYWNERK